MLISKKSRRKSDQFESRFRDGSGGGFPLRQYVRAREDFTSGLVHLGLRFVFVVTLVVCTGPINALFPTHGADLSPWFGRIAMVVMVFFELSVVRRLYYKVLELRGIRREMHHLRAEIDHQAG